MIKFRTRWHASDMARIEALEVVRETEKTITLPPDRPMGRECRESKRSDFQNWFDTWIEAHEFLITEAHGAVNNAQLRLDHANKMLEGVNGMKQ